MPNQETARRETVEYFVQCQQPDGTWEQASSTATDLDFANERLAARRRMRPEFVYRIAQRTTVVVVGPVEAAVSVPPPATRADDRDAEEHRLALSEALGLGTGAPWDAIHDRVTELGLPPLGRDPVARRLGLLAAYRATILTEAAECAYRIARRLDEQQHDQRAQGAWDVENVLRAEVRRLAAEASATTKPETGSCAHCGKPVRLITGTLAEWWVHEPGGHTICFPEQAASSPRATPKPAAGVGQDGAQPQ